MSLSTTQRFELYRYQILPINRNLQIDFINNISSIEELLERKNIFFNDALDSQDSFSNSQHKVIVNKHKLGEDFFLLKVAHGKLTKLETEDFKTETVDNWPSLLVAIWNHPEKQIIAIQKRTTAFSSTKTVAKIILEAISKKLAINQLNIKYSPLFVKEDFWKLIAKHESKIQKIDFEFITPNMANISSVLSEDLKQLAKATNSVNNHLSLAADNGSSLNINEDNPTVSGLVDYSSEGGGDISIKIKGVKKVHHTKTTIKDVTIDEMELIGEPTNVAQTLREILR